MTAANPKTLARDARQWDACHAHVEPGSGASDSERATAAKVIAKLTAAYGGRPGAPDRYTPDGFDDWGGPGPYPNDPVAAEARRKADVAARLRAQQVRQDAARNGIRDIPGWPASPLLYQQYTNGEPHDSAEAEIHRRIRIVTPQEMSVILRKLADIAPHVEAELMHRQQFNATLEALSTRAVALGYFRWLDNRVKHYSGV